MSIVLNEHFEEDGAAVYRAACQLGCEGIVKTPRLNLSPGPVAELDQSQPAAANRVQALASAAKHPNVLSRSAKAPREAAELFI